MERRRQYIYSITTNTAEKVIGNLAIFFGAWRLKRSKLILANMMFVAFIKQNCRYSQRAVSLLSTVTKDYEIIDATKMSPSTYQDQLAYYGKPKSIQHSTYPAILGYDDHFNVEFFGGSDDLMQYLEEKNMEE